MTQSDLFAGEATTASHRICNPARAGSIPAASTRAWGAPVRPGHEDGVPVGDPSPSANHAPDGRGKRDTSRLAYADMLGKLAPAEHRVMIYLADNEDATRAEIARAIGMPLAGVCGRVNRLIQAGRLVEEPRRACGVSGRQAHPVRLA